MESHHGLRTLQKKRTTNFREDETKLLIQLWGSPQIQNKLYLTHRKAPVMRILAANMQKHGFYRTPDEIKTRIRNLKCLYHRIKRTVHSGTGVGTVDPDWPHYKAMDAILTREAIKKETLYKDNVLEGPRCEDIKQEVEDIDINDDMESYSTASNHGSEFEDETDPPPPSLTPAPTNRAKTVHTTPNLQTILPNLSNFAIPLQTQQVTSSQNGTRPNGVTSLPFPLLIVQPKPAGNNDKKTGTQTVNLTPVQTLQQHPQKQNNSTEIGALLRELLTVQKENLDVERERLALEKEKLEYHKTVGDQLMTLIPIVGCALQKIAVAKIEEQQTAIPKNERKRKKSDDGDDVLKDGKILKSVLKKNFKKYMLGEHYEDDDVDDEYEEEVKDEK